MTIEDSSAIAAPAFQMISRLRIGSAGWPIPKSISDDFPADGSHLQRYARRLNGVDISPSFYRPHKPNTYARRSGACRHRSILGKNAAVDYARIETAVGFASSNGSSFKGCRRTRERSSWIRRDVQSVGAYLIAEESSEARFRTILRCWRLKRVSSLIDTRVPLHRSRQAISILDFRMASEWFHTPRQDNHASRIFRR
jgi:hypothetical protein